MKKIIWSISGLIVALLLIIIIKTVTFKSLQSKAEPLTLPGFGDKSVLNLSKAITYPTISYENNLPVDSDAFNGYHNFLIEAYPLIHAELKKEIFSNLSLLYTWQGKDTTLKPVILMAHMDVVSAGDTGSWIKKPFSGENDGTFIWGRGTLDDKSAMISLFEAVEKLVSEGYQPERTIYLAFGHDEEIGGSRGAGVIASTLKARGVETEFILDEGMAVTNGMVPMIDRPVALIGISEKGYLSAKLTVEMKGGHSSTPERDNAISVLNRALYNILTKQMKADIQGPVNDFIRFVGPEMPFYAKAVFANKWLFKGIILNIYTKSGSGNALVRTTTAPTIIQAGIKDNIIPIKAEAVINFRILPGEKSGDVLQHLKKTISDDRVKISVLNWINEPAPVSPVNTHGFDVLQTTIGQVYPEAIVAPTLMLGSSDSRNYTGISTNIYRFAPIVVTAEDMARIHGLNEKNKIDDYMRGIGFYYQLIRNIDK